MIPGDAISLQIHYVHIQTADLLFAMNRPHENCQLFFHKNEDVYTGMKRCGAPMVSTETELPLFILWEAHICI